ncbi:hypothetical protein DIKCMJMK_03925 [Shewanella oneidensis]|uniref:Uncharacterized protein n=1 Tax=Shewanella oneidensis (strain ATCC 700550 / JCM 31522 / CIP 106686 / LMG 19005 / NCIMB 14063 / MR-1) TaxID=211586 RepID=Q8E7Z7_SHEON|nr:hypothetical protein SO_A0171 [Shewanella oneidensis MR-1]MEE2030027.1 hypothetical protein [Shewanella oneidensis]
MKNLLIFSFILLAVAFSITQISPYYHKYSYCKLQSEEQTQPNYGYKLPKEFENIGKNSDTNNLSDKDLTQLKKERELSFQKCMTK